MKGKEQESHKKILEEGEEEMWRSCSCKDREKGNDGSFPQKQKEMDSEANASQMKMN